MKNRQQIQCSWLLGFACLWLLGGGIATAQKSGGAAEYQVKAAFIYNFIKFTDWPTNAFAATNSPIVIGIVGENPFGTTLDQAVENELVHDRQLIVKQLQPGEDMRHCQVLFISYSERERVDSLLRQVQGSPALTISDLPDFVEQGGMVNLLLVNKSVKMAINPGAVAAARLQTSSKLLSLARIVNSK